jgi:hypothetical protein
MASYEVPTYTDIGFSVFLERPLLQGSSQQSISGQQSSGSSGTLNFDSTQTSGALGDKIQVGSITIDGSSGKITVSDDSGNTVITIGDIS